MPGRKTDVADALRLADLLAHGLIRASFVPEAPEQQVEVQLQRLRHRRGAKTAISAVAASILTAVSHMLCYGTFYHDLGADQFRRTSPVIRPVASTAKSLNSGSSAHSLPCHKQRFSCRELRGNREAWVS